MRVRVKVEVLAQSRQGSELGVYRAFLILEPVRRSIECVTEARSIRSLRGQRGKKLADDGAAEPGIQQSADLGHRRGRGLVVDPLAAAGARGSEQPLIFVIPQRTDADAGLRCEFADPHPTILAGRHQRGRGLP